MGEGVVGEKSGVALHKAPGYFPVYRLGAIRHEVITVAVYRCSVEMKMMRRCQDKHKLIPCIFVDLAIRRRSDLPRKDVPCMRADNGPYVVVLFFNGSSEVTADLFLQHLCVHRIKLSGNGGLSVCADVFHIPVFFL